MRPPRLLRRVLQSNHDNTVRFSRHPLSLQEITSDFGSNDSERIEYLKSITMVRPTLAPPMGPCFTIVPRRRSNTSTTRGR